MMSTWNLDALYTSYESPEFKQDMQMIHQAIQAMEDLATSLPDEIDTKLCHAILETLQQFQLVSRKVGTYISLNGSTDTTDPITVGYRDRYSALVSGAAKPITMLQKALGRIKNLDAQCAENPLIKEHEFFVREIQSRNRYLLNDDVEEVISKMELNASDAWDQLQSYMTSTLEIDYDGNSMTLSSLRNLAYSPDRTVRKSAYEAEIKGYDKIKDSVSFALNSIKGEANVISQMRGYESVLDMTLIHSRLSQESLNAMLTSIQKYLPDFHRYLRHKAALFGHKNGLPFYDLFALLPCDQSREYTIEEARDYLVKNFNTFSQEISDIVNRAYDEQWIDFYPRKGKVGGAFCANLPFLKQSRVLTNFDGSLSDVITLAHELGHAYHGTRIQQHSPLNTRYTMPVAETASTFNETVIMNAAIRDAQSNQEKAMLIESMLQDITQVICDIYSRYLFETEVVEKRKNEFLFSKDLEQIMIEAQKKAYGQGLDHTCLHPFMWVCKGHYYNVGLNFYNFPYAFGCLFARGLYAQFIKEGTSFVDKYNKLLTATTIKSCEDVAMMAEIDITKNDFWENSLENVKEYIDQFIELTPIKSS